MPVRQTFRKEERLCSRKLIEKVVREGSRIANYPFQLKWIQAELKTKYPAQVALSVSKINFKRAVDRNRIKRLMREVYRKEKSGFYETLNANNSQCALLIAYIGKTIPQYEEVKNKLSAILRRFEEDFVSDSR